MCLVLEKCKMGVRIINVARGGIVNEADLVEALDSGKAAGAAFDVYEQVIYFLCAHDLADYLI